MNFGGYGVGAAYGGHPAAVNNRYTAAGYAGHPSLIYNGYIADGYGGYHAGHHSVSALRYSPIHRMQQQQQQQEQRRQRRPRTTDERIIEYPQYRPHIVNCRFVEG